MRRAIHRKDNNQDEVIAALKGAGATVEIIGKPLDLLVGYRRQWLMMEIKSTKYELSRTPTATRKRQMAFAERHPNGGPIATVTDVDGALRAIALL